MFLRGLLVAVAGACALPAQSLEDRARALLEAKCTGCHGAAQMSGLDLRSPEALLKGGKRGPALPLIMKAVRREGELQMPPGKTALSSEEITLLEQWVQAGAPFPGTAKNAGPAWWSFKPIQRPPGKHTIDEFLNAKLAERKLRALPAADKLTLIRRATFDLHGLPPTPEAIDAFVSLG